MPQRIVKPYKLPYRVVACKYLDVKSSFCKRGDLVLSLFNYKLKFRKVRRYLYYI